MTQSTLTLPAGMEITGNIKPGYENILTSEALALVAKLSREFESRRQQLLSVRVERAKRLDAGERPDFLPETAHIRAGDWKVAPIPKALECRRVEITGPVDRKMVINALNSGADSYMTDFEDSNTPNWENQIDGQINMFDAVRRTIALEQNGKSYKLNDKVATLVVRPRGWHLDEKHVLVDGKRMGSSASTNYRPDLGRQDLNWISPDQIERIEVVRGPMSSLYGSDAMGGVINIITRKATSTSASAVR